MSNTCSNCRYWLPMHKGDGSYCDFINTVDGEQLVSTSGCEIVATAHDDTGLDVFLRTGPDFSCPSFSSSQPKTRRDRPDNLFEMKFGNPNSHRCPKCDTDFTRNSNVTCQYVNTQYDPDDDKGEDGPYSHGYGHIENGRYVVDFPAFLSGGAYVLSTDPHRCSLCDHVVTLNT